MNDLTLKLLIDKSVKRKVHILSFLLESPTAVPIVELEILCGVSIKTLQQDIAYLIEMLPENLRIVIRNKQNALENVGENIRIHEFVNYLVKNNPLFSVIEAIFEGKKQSVLRVAEELFITEATLRKHLVILKKVLTEYNLTLTTVPLEIIGSEIDIRFFYFHYFRHAHTKAQLEIPDELDNFFNEGLIQTEKAKANLNLDYQQMIYWFTITNKRRAQKKYVSLDEGLILKYANNRGYLNFSNNVQKLFETNTIKIIEELNDQEMLYSYILLFSVIFYDGDSGGYYFTDDFYRDLDAFDELVESYFVQSKLIFSLNMEFNVIVKAFLMNVTLLNDLSPMFQKVSSQLRRLAEEKYPETLINWLDLLKEKAQFTYPYDVAVSLTLLTAAKARSHKRVLFCFTGETTSLSYLKTRALRTVPNEMEVHFYFNHTLDDILLKKGDVDICVFNFQPLHPLSFSQLIQLSVLPSEAEWAELLLQLHTL
ncbi:helix-turn-helix domain-containing protein [Carnobacterium maltaromaticum]|uniref:helix-turn-helix domain-containing protein n=1 Tax=Carnobacterium maltaromaticum TaxID=2751 RepID=UPI00295EC363|nr:helix-turn-helix domain-containing protein [Carnobacterium maltaromaticum]